MLTATQLCHCQHAMNKSVPNQSRGFTLIELLVVIAIIA
ncbi:MAG: prepilin-type N-terminal cleavage/methylation domain-containing protein, partial [Verrucomicrobia bacterium]|nr:prepilin-type N-terminal cleavage/methylation domain-containing protein [Verrucomicrobiota bacterium]